MVVEIGKDNKRREYLKEVAMDFTEKLAKQFKDPREVFLIALYQAQHVFLAQAVNIGDFNQVMQNFEGWCQDTRSMMQRSARKNSQTTN